MTKVQWDELLKQYLADSRESYSSLAKKYNLSKRTVTKHAVKHHWHELKKQATEIGYKKFTENESDNIANVLARQLALSGLMIDNGLEAFRKTDFSNMTPHQTVTLLRTGIEIEREALQTQRYNNLSSRINVTTPITIPFDEKRHQELMDWLKKENAEFNRTTLPKLLEQDKGNKIKIQEILVKI